MTAIRGISSMATRQLLGELGAMYQKLAGVETRIESVGGVDAARRVEAGEPFDIVVLASDAIAKLQDSGKVAAGSRVDLVRSGVSIAVRAGGKLPDVRTEEGLKRAVLAAPAIGYSTGPSGTALVKLFERWGIADALKGKLVQAPPGVPVGSLVADGKVAIGFQQLSELIHQPGIEIAGAMPAPVEINTVFSGAICATCTQRDAARELLLFMASPPTADAKRRQGMEPA
jgi:molybdate transport system substrate-binding protein